MQNEMIEERTGMLYLRRDVVEPFSEARSSVNKVSVELQRRRKR
jgi:hypothetical protein